MTRTVRKAQASLDLIIVSVVILVAFLALTKVYLDRDASNRDTRQTLSATQMTAKIARAINAVAAGENGTSYTVAFGNESAELDAYVICVNNSRAETLWGAAGRSIAFPLVTGRVSATPSSLSLYACTAADRSNVTIQNVDGTILLS